MTPELEHRLVLARAGRAGPPSRVTDGRLPTAVTHRVRASGRCGCARRGGVWCGSRTDSERAGLLRARLWHARSPRSAADAPPDLVADGPDGFDALAGGVVELLVSVALGRRSGRRRLAPVSSARVRHRPGARSRGRRFPAPRNARGRAGRRVGPAHRSDRAPTTPVRTLAHEVLQPIAQTAVLSRPLDGVPDYLAVEAYYGASHDGAVHLDDLLARRMRISIQRSTSRSGPPRGRASRRNRARQVRGRDRPRGKALPHPAPPGTPVAATARRPHRRCHRPGAP